MTLFRESHRDHLLEVTGEGKIYRTENQIVSKGRGSLIHTSITFRVLRLRFEFVVHSSRL